MGRSRREPPEGEAADYGMPFIEPGSPEDKAGRIREEDKSDELDVFERRLEWFRLYHSDRSGWTSDLRFRQAVEHAVQLESLLPLVALDPGGEPPTRSYELVRVKGRRSARGRKAKNPAPRSSLGFASDPVEVVFDEAELPGGADLKVALNPELARNVDLSSVRMFRFDEEVNSWVLVPRSCMARDLSYAWVRAHRPGVYVAAGLPRDPGLLQAVLTLHAYRPQLEVAGRLESHDALLDALVDLMSVGGRVKTLGGELPGGFDPGELDLPGGDLGLEDFRERLGELEFPERGLPEWEIIDDICPPWWPWPRKGWPWPPFKWPPEVLWPPFVWPFFPLEWTSIGPRNVNGRIKSLAIHPTIPGILWAGAANGGVWKTTNAGATWLPMMSQELSLAIGALAVSPSHPLTLYAATGEDTPGWGPSWSGAGVYKSTDGGASWALLAPIGSWRCTKVLIHPTNPNVVYVAGDGGLHKSTNGGASWTDVRTDHVSDALLDPNSPTRIYAAVWGMGVYRSTNAGSTWSLLSTGIPTGAGADWIKLAMGRNGANGTNFLLAKMGADSGTIYRSTDGGTNWALVASGVQPASYNEWTNMIAVDPNNHNRILAGGVGLSRATNGSTFAGVGGTHADHHQAVHDSANSNVVWVATDGGVYRSTDAGATWTLRSHQLVATQLYSTGVSQTTLFRVGGATQDQGIVQTEGSADWVDTGAGNEGGFFVVDPNDDLNVYTTPWSAAGAPRRSTDGGTSWTDIASGLGGAGVGDLAVRPGNSSQLLCVGGNKIFRSASQGNSWTSAATVNGNALRVVFSESDPLVCYSGTDGGRVYRSGNGGTSGSWAEPYAPADRPPFGVIAAIAVSATNPNRLFIGYAGFGVAHVWRSTDGGAHWTNASGSGPATLPDIPVNALVVHHLNSDVVYAATDIGVFRTLDGGATWQTFSEGMPRAFVSGLVMRRSSRMLHASTMGRGEYKRRVWFA
jgi:hypothetical protein